MKMNVEFSKRIIASINFLSVEAHNQGETKIARILKNCTRDICISLENDSHEHASFLLDSDLFAAIEFLTKFASLRDQEIREEILTEIKTIQKELTKI